MRIQEELRLLFEQMNHVSNAQKGWWKCVTAGHLISLYMETTIINIHTAFTYWLETSIFKFFSLILFFLFFLYSLGWHNFHRACTKNLPGGPKPYGVSMVQLCMPVSRVWWINIYRCFCSCLFADGRSVEYKMHSPVSLKKKKMTTSSPNSLNPQLLSRFTTNHITKSTCLLLWYPATWHTLTGDSTNSET